MPLTKSQGNMYPWVTHTHTHLAGECPHRCSYCYVQATERRFRKGRYRGPLRLVEKEFRVGYGSGRTIFVEHCNDLWASSVPDDWIYRVLMHCRAWPDNEYVFQSKNPNRFAPWVVVLPPRRILGCTIETDDDVAARVSGAPPPSRRLRDVAYLAKYGERVFVTIEPILRNDPSRLTQWMAAIGPEFVNVGADSKGTGLDEPSPGELRRLLDGLHRAGLTVRQNTNLARLLRSDD